MVNICSGSTNGLTTCQAKLCPVELLFERSHFNRCFAPEPIGLVSLWNTRQIWNRCTFTPTNPLNTPHHIPTSLYFPIAEAIWSHPGVTVAPRGAAILAKWRSGLTTYNLSNFRYGTKTSFPFSLMSWRLSDTEIEGLKVGKDETFYLMLSLTYLNAECSALMTGLSPYAWQSRPPIKHLLLVPRAGARSADGCPRRSL